jgi:hypothetical protein
MMCAPTDIFVVNLGDNQFSSFPINVALPYRPEMDEAIVTIVAALEAKQIIQ